MSVPPTVTTKNVTGVYTLNRSISDSSQALLKMQNIGFLIRQAVKYSDITLTLKQAPNEAGKEVVGSRSLSTGGVASDEEWILDGEVKEREHWIWGKVEGSCRFIKVADLEDDYLKDGWDQECMDGFVIQSAQKSTSDTWTATQIVGFGEIDGQRRQVRRILGKKGEQVERIRMVYDWKEAVA